MHSLTHAYANFQTNMHAFIHAYTSTNIRITYIHSFIDTYHEKYTYIPIQTQVHSILAWKKNALVIDGLRLPNEITRTHIHIYMHTHIHTYVRDAHQRGEFKIRGSKGHARGSRDIATDLNSIL